MRLQKLLAEAGLGSRRAVEDWIRAGRLTIGGRKALLGDRATAADELRLDGRRLRLKAGEAGPQQLLLYYKPAGEVTTRSDPEGRPTVFERLPPPRRGRWINVGRLDVNTTGLLLLTTDGRLAHRLMHPSGEVEREYLVRVRGRPSEAVIAQLLLGVKLEDGAASFDRITADTWEEPGGRGGSGTHSTFRVVLTEGRNREVRRLWQAVGFEVSRLKRIRYGPIELPPDLKPGGTRLAGPASLEKLAQAVARPPAQGPKAKV
ncbi:MAG TPA: pseudouridine synthase [Steroidobacteraceae bacterium]|nr:pseudouridine synthase [Steroidobacteraceae bacterium]